MTCINGPELGNHAITSEYVMPLSMTTLQFRLFKTIDKTVAVKKLIVRPFVGNHNKPGAWPE